MAKLAVINRQAKREKMVKQFAAKREALTKLINDQSISEEDRYQARLKLQVRRRLGLRRRGRGKKIAGRDQPRQLLQYLEDRVFVE